MNQKTIQNTITLSGVGLHTGKKTTVVLKPANANEGICFTRTDLPEKPVIKVSPSTAVTDPNISRCSAIEESGVRVSTVEHLLAAFSGLGVDNVSIEINGEEVPGLDGSSAEIVEALKKSGLTEQSAPREFIQIKESITVTDQHASIVMVPADDFKISYTLDYEHPSLHSQIFTRKIDQSIFEKDIAPARTFCLEDEVTAIRSRGLGKGANEKNTLVMGKNGPVGNSLRFTDECARHKVLDLIGDLYLLGRPVRGHIYATRSGHRLNRALVKKIISNGSGRVFGINDIMTILPHRYPFLLVDRVIEVERGKKGIGIKNVTINDGFFQGHFPTRPVMPGVLMVEAMAQTAGVVVLTSGLHPGKVALFMSIDAVKFRRVVEPGDQLLMEVEIVRDRERTAQVKGVGRVNGEVAVEAEMLFSYTDSKYLNG